MPQLALANITATFWENNDENVNNHTVTGWSDDADALTMPDEFEIMNTRFGAGGDLAAFRTGMRGGDVTIKLLPTSPSVVHFMRRLQFVLRPENYLRFDGRVTDNTNDFYFDLEDGVMVASPLGVTIGSGDAANRMFRFSFARIVPHWDKVNWPRSDS